MITLGTITLGSWLLTMGLLFPTLSLLTAIASAWTFWRSNRHASPVLIPLIGPILLTFWVFVENVSLWMLFAVWGLDLGTLAFAAALPRLLREYRNTSPFVTGHFKYSTSGRNYRQPGVKRSLRVIIALTVGCFKPISEFHRFCMQTLQSEPVVEMAAFGLS